MGDNRNNSADSSVHLCRPNATRCDESDAFVPVNDVVGKVFALAWPLGRAHFVVADADIEQAVNGAMMGIFFNQGQVCCAGSRPLGRRALRTNSSTASRRGRAARQGRRPDGQR